MKKNNKIITVLSIIIAGMYIIFEYICTKNSVVISTAFLTVGIFLLSELLLKKLEMTVYISSSSILAVNIAILLLSYFFTYTRLYCRNEVGYLFLLFPVLIIPICSRFIFKTARKRRLSGSFSISGIITSIISYTCLLISELLILKKIDVSSLYFATAVINIITFILMWLKIIGYGHKKQLIIATSCLTLVWGSILTLKAISAGINFEIIKNIISSRLEDCPETLPILPGISIIFHLIIILLMVFSSDIKNDRMKYHSVLFYAAGTALLITTVFFIIPFSVYYNPFSPSGKIINTILVILCCLFIGTNNAGREKIMQYCNMPKKFEKIDEIINIETMEPYTGSDTDMFTLIEVHCMGKVYDGFGTIQKIPEIGQIAAEIEIDLDDTTSVAYVYLRNNNKELVIAPEWIAEAVLERSQLF